MSRTHSLDADPVVPRLPPFVSSEYQYITIITILTDTITAMNSTWLKEKLFDYIDQHQPRMVILNMCNVNKVDRMGVGALISLNSRLKQNYDWTLACVSPEVEDFLKQSHMMHMFKQIHLNSPCPISEADGGDQEDWEYKLTEFLLENLTNAVFEVQDTTEHNPYPVQTIRRISKRYTGQLVYTDELDEADLYPETPAYEFDPSYIAAEKRHQQRELWKQIRDFTMIGLFSTCFVGVGIGILFTSLNSDWIKIINESKTSLRAPKIDMSKDRQLNKAEIIDHFDKDGDGEFTQDDWRLLSSKEKLVIINHGFHDRKNKNNPFNFKR